MKSIPATIFLILFTLVIAASSSFVSCGGGGGGGGGVTPAETSTVISGTVVDAFIAGATVTAYRVNANGTLGAQIGASAQTDQLGNYSIYLGKYTGPVYVSSTGGTYTDAATGQPVNLAPSFTLSAIVPNATQNVTAQITPLTDIAAREALFLASQGSPVATAAADANTLVSDYFGLSEIVLNTDLLDLTAAGCMTTEADQASVDATGILAGISQLAKNHGVSTPDLVQALVEDVTADGKFDGKAAETAIHVNLTPGPGTVALSTMEGTGMSGLAGSITSFMASEANACQAPPVSQTVITALTDTDTTVFLSPVKDITAFSFTSPPATGIIGQSGRTILVNVPSGTNVTALVATFATTGESVRVGSTVQASGATSNDFTSPVTYTVTAADGSIKSYTVTVRAGALPPQWARTVTAGGSHSMFNGVAAAPDGSVYAAGKMLGTGTYNFGNSVTAKGTDPEENMVLVKYASSGLAQWARTVTAGSNNTTFIAVSAASDGSVYAAGYISYTGAYSFGNDVIAAGTNGWGPNIILVKYDSSGLAQWARTVTSESAEDHGSLFNGVAVASDGSVYAAGYIHGTDTLNFGNGVTAAGTNTGSNIILVKYANSGAAQWARTVTAGGGDSGFYGVSAASDGSVYAAGYIGGTGTLTFGNGVTAAGKTAVGNSVVLLKYSSQGAAQWARTVTGGIYDSEFYSVSAASDGSVYAAGYISGTEAFDFGNSVIATGAYYSGSSIVLVKYSSQGAAQWAKTLTEASGDSIFYSVSPSSDGSVYAAGEIYYNGSYDFGNGVTATGPCDRGPNIVLVKYASTGVTQWARTQTAGSGSSFNGVSEASDGSVYAAGGIFGTGSFDFGGVTAIGTYNGWNDVLVKYY